MTSNSNVVYENHLKKAYSVKNDYRHLAITDTSCYQLNEETAWLIAELPDKGEKELYFNSLSHLGLNEPNKIFDILFSIGVLRVKGKRSWKDLSKKLLAPSIKLLSAQVQEKIFKLFRSDPASINKVTQILAAFSVVGLLWGALLLIAGPEKAIPVPIVGKVSVFMLCLLIILGSLVHELGHSFAAMSTGIGLRPIGFSIYLIYPVFYTNVSGIEKVGFVKKILIDCGGFIFQGAFLFLLLLACSFTGNVTLEEVARWIMIIVLFNLNPLFRTDGYWLYKDMYTEFKTKPWARGMHYLYLTAFAAFSIYILWLVGRRLEDIWHGINMLIHSPNYFFSGGYRLVFAAYFIHIGLYGGLRRFQEGRQEWLELRVNKTYPVAGLAS